MTVQDIIKEYLKAHGYDGLCLPEEECGCRIDDLMPGPCVLYRCIPGKKRIKDDGEWEIVSE